MKINGLLLHATWINYPNTMLSVRSLTKKDTYCMIPFIKSS